MSDFKLGQKVWNMQHGWGVVKDTNLSADYPICVEYNTGDCVSYTEYGVEFENENRTLFFKEIPIPEDALIPPVEEVELSVGDIVALTDGRIVYVEGYSDKTRKVFFCHSKIPRNLEDAFGPTSVQKSLIRKVMGNLNA